MHQEWGSIRIELLQGDLTEQKIDAIVNAANSALAGGGGVDGAIHRAAGPALMEQTRRRYPNGCPTGSAVATEAGNLPAKYVFHAVGPIWRGGEAGEEALLRSAVSSCLELAEEYHCQGIAFPAISTGAYNYPLDRAADAMLTTLIDAIPNLESVKCMRIVLFDRHALERFESVFASLTGSPPAPDD